MKQLFWIALAIVLVLAPSVVWAQCTTGWYEGTDCPEVFRRGVGAYYEGKIYITGGFLDEGYNNTMWIYDIAADSWSTGSDYDVDGWVNSCMAEYEGTILLLGGYDDGSPLDTVKLYDIDTDTWSDGASLPNEMSGGSCGVIGDYAYAGGGSDIIGHTSAVYAYDIALNTWDDTLADLPVHRRWSASGVSEDYFFVINGYRDETIDDSIAYYNPSTDTWAETTGSGAGYWSSGGAQIGGNIYQLGGFAGSKATSELTHVYNFVGATWASFDNLLYATASPAAGSIPDFGGLLYVIGGGNGITDIKKTQLYKLCLAAATEIAPTEGYNEAAVAVTITGAGFEATDTAYLTDETKTEIILTGITVVDENTITAEIPADSTVGVYDLIVESVSGEEALLEDAYEVLETADDDTVDDDTVDDDVTDDDTVDDDVSDDDAADDDAADDDAVDDDAVDDDDDDIAADDDDDDDDDDDGCGC